MFGFSGLTVSRRLAGLRHLALFQFFQLELECEMFGKAKVQSSRYPLTPKLSMISTPEGPGCAA
jgi:hypothetical protein